MFVVATRSGRLLWVGCAVGVAVALGLGWFFYSGTSSNQVVEEPPPVLEYKPRQELDSSGFLAIFAAIKPWPATASWEDQSVAYRDAAYRGVNSMEAYKQQGFNPQAQLQLTSLLHANGSPGLAYKALEEFEAEISDNVRKYEWLYTIIYYKGLTGLRMGENDNCVSCRGQSACIFPIAPSAHHKNTHGSKLAVKHFTEYLEKFPDDLEVKWLLNLAHMTLGEYPDKVDPRYRLKIDPFCTSEFDIGVFRDVSHLVGLNQFNGFERINQSGGAIMEDFDNDGLLDIVVTSWAPSEEMVYYRNKGDGTFEERSRVAGLEGLRGGLFCVQTDYNNDGHMDIFIPRGSWMPRHLAQRPSLLRNNGNGTFTDVAREAGLTPVTNSTSAGWADFDNDGYLDLFLCCQKQPSLIYRNKGDGTFEDVTERAGLSGLDNVLGSAWIDYDNDNYPDLFLNISTGILGKTGVGTARLFHNNHNGTFTDVSRDMGIDGPVSGFACWAWDYDNDGWLDIFAASSVHTLEEVVQGVLDLPCKQTATAKLWRNLGGKGFKDMSKEVGLDKIYSPMGSNFGDYDNDGYLDFYLGTGDPNLSTLIPNRMFKNVGGKRFSEITGSTRTGHLQKGHAVACGDWDRNGSVDVFIELGGAVHGDQYHNVLFQNPGQGNNWLTVKLVGSKSNRAAIGARIKVVTAGEQPLTVQRHVSSGSSFGANPLEQHIGLGKAQRVARVEIYWPTSGETQVFEDIAVNQGIVVTEGAREYRKRNWTPLSAPKE